MAQDPRRDVSYEQNDCYHVKFCAIRMGLGGGLMVMKRVVGWV